LSPEKHPGEVHRTARHFSGTSPGGIYPGSPGLLPVAEALGHRPQRRVGDGRPPTDLLRHLGASELDAYELLTKVASLHLAEMVDPNYVIVAGIDKRYLPPRP
jgi:hypothetical protein